MALLSLNLKYSVCQITLKETEFLTIKVQQGYKT